MSDETTTELFRAICVLAWNNGSPSIRKRPSDLSAACYFPQQGDKCVIYSSGTVAPCLAPALSAFSSSSLLFSCYTIPRRPGAPPSCLAVKGYRIVRQSELMPLCRRPAWPHLRVCSLKRDLGILRLWQKQPLSPPPESVVHGFIIICCFVAITPQPSSVLVSGLSHDPMNSPVCPVKNIYFAISFYFSLPIFRDVRDVYYFNKLQ